MNHTLAANAIKRKRRATTKSRNVLAAALCFCLLGMSHSTFALQPITKQIDSTNQTVLKPNVSLETGQASEYPTRKFGPPYPFTAHQLKEMLLKVAALKDEPKEGAELMNIFNIPATELHHQEANNSLPDGRQYVFKARKDWYFNLSYFLREKSRYSNLSFGWGSQSENRVEHFPEPPTGLCIRSEKFLKELGSVGWQIKSKTEIQEIPLTYELYKNNFHALSLFFSHEEKCLLSFYVLWNKEFRS